LCHWLENLRDLDHLDAACGDTKFLPWYTKDGDVDCSRIREKRPKRKRERMTLTQDEDVLDTWFSSALCAVFPTFGCPTNRDLKIVLPDVGLDHRPRHNLSVGIAHGDDGLKFIDKDHSLMLRDGHGAGQARSAHVQKRSLTASIHWKFSISTAWMPPV